MHAWQFDHYGRYDEVLAWVERDPPVPGPGQTVIETSAVGLNFPDLLICQGLYQARAPLPAVPGVEGVGRVVATGPGSRFRVGERVVGFCNLGGMLAERFVVDDATAWSVPDAIDDRTVAALSVTYGTSYFALVHRAPATGSAARARRRRGNVWRPCSSARSSVPRHRRGEQPETGLCRRHGADQ